MAKNDKNGIILAENTKLSTTNNGLSIPWYKSIFSRRLGAVVPTPNNGQPGNREIGRSVVALPTLPHFKDMKDALASAFEGGGGAGRADFASEVQAGAGGLDNIPAIAVCLSWIAANVAVPRMGIGKDGTEEITRDHPIIDLFDKPSAFCSRTTLISPVGKDFVYEGIAFVLRIRENGQGKPVELKYLPAKMVKPVRVSKADFLARYGIEAMPYINATPVSSESRFKRDFYAAPLLNDSYLAGWQFTGPLAGNIAFQRDALVYRAKARDEILVSGLFGGYTIEDFFTGFEGKQWIHYYEYTNSVSDGYLGAGTLLIPAADMIVLKNGQHPDDDLLGVSVKLSALLPAYLDWKSTMFAANTSKNQARPGVVATHKPMPLEDEDGGTFYNNLSKEQLTNYEKHIDDRTSGENVGKTIALDGEWSVSFLKGDIDPAFLKYCSDMSKADVAALFHIPPAALHFVVGLENNNNRSNGEAAIAEAYEGCLMPMMVSIASDIETAFYFEPGFRVKKGHFIAFDFNIVPQMQSRQIEKKKVNISVYLGGGCTLNEFRASIGLPPAPEGDKFFEPRANAAATSQQDPTSKAGLN